MQCLAARAWAKRQRRPGPGHGLVLGPVLGPVPALELVLELGPELELEPGPGPELVLVHGRAAALPGHAVAGTERRQQQLRLGCSLRAYLAERNEFVVATGAVVAVEGVVVASRRRQGRA